MIRVEIDTSEFNKVVKALIKRGGDFSPVMRDVGEHMHGSVMQNFEEQGRPEKWEPLKFSTLVSRYIRGNRERKRKRRVLVRGGTGYSRGFTRLLAMGKILIDTGRLRSSITYEPKKFSVRIGTGLVYGGIHQTGGKAGRGRRVKIPARPYLVVQEEDRRYIDEVIVDYLMKKTG